MSSSNVSPASVLDAPASNTSADQSSSTNPDLTPQMALGEAEFETVADRLMEELFADVERMLDRGVDLSEPPEPPKQPPASDPAQFSFNLRSSEDASSEPAGLILAPKLTPRPSILAQAESEEELADLAELMAEIQADPTAEKLTKTLNKLMLGLLVTAIAAGGSAWYFRDRLLPLTAFVKSAITPAPVAIKSAPIDLQQQQDENFLAYVGRSLDRIERDAKQQRAASAIAGTGAMPSPSVAAPTGLERIYVPVPQPPQIALSNPPAIVPQPFPQTSFPQTSFPQTSVSSSVPTQPTVATAPATAPSTTPNIAVANNHTLIGILELGDRSAALIEVNGTPQRIQIGEAIGASGWILVSVKNQEAIVRRNGEVRSIYVGQQF